MLLERVVRQGLVVLLDQLHGLVVGLNLVERDLLNVDARELAQHVLQRGDDGRFGELLRNGGLAHQRPRHEGDAQLQHHVLGGLLLFRLLRDPAVGLLGNSVHLDELLDARVLFARPFVEFIRVVVVVLDIVRGEVVVEGPPQLEDLAVFALVLLKVAAVDHLQRFDFGHRTLAQVGRALFVGHGVVLDVEVGQLGAARGLADDNSVVQPVVLERQLGQLLKVVDGAEAFEVVGVQDESLEFRQVAQNLKSGEVRDSSLLQIEEGQLLQVALAQLDVFCVRHHVLAEDELLQLGEGRQNAADHLPVDAHVDQDQILQPSKHTHGTGVEDLAGGVDLNPDVFGDGLRLAQDVACEREQLELAQLVSEQLNLVPVEDEVLFEREFNEAGQHLGQDVFVADARDQRVAQGDLLDLLEVGDLVPDAVEALELHHLLVMLHGLEEGLGVVFDENARAGGR